MHACKAVIVERAAIDLELRLVVVSICRRVFFIFDFAFWFVDDVVLRRHRRYDHELAGAREARVPARSLRANAATQRVLVSIRDSTEMATLAYAGARKAVDTA